MGGLPPAKNLNWVSKSVRIPRFFVKSIINLSQVIPLEKEQNLHLVKVLRKKEGDSVTLFNGTGREYYGKIIKTGLRESEILITSFSAETRKPIKKIHLGLCILKKDAMNRSISKSTELGVYEITPIYSEFCTVSEKLIAKRWANWQKVAISSSEQCGLNLIPSINPVCSLKEWILKTPGKKLMALQSGKKLEKDFLRSNSVSLLVGPEGGFSQDEIKCVDEDQVKKFSLGKRTLRAETAPIVAISVIHSLSGEF